MGLARYKNVVADTGGNVIQGASVSVVATDTGTAALLYSDPLGISPIVGNVVLTGSDGAFTFYVEAGTYNITVTLAGSVIGTDTNVQILAEQAAVLESFYRSTDSGRWDNAMQRAYESGAKRVAVLADRQQVFNFAEPIAVNRNQFTIETEHPFGATFNLQGSDPYIMDVGNASTMTFEFYVKNLVFTRSTATVNSAVIRMRNVFFFGMKKTRMYMDNKFTRGLDLYSVGNGRLHDNLTEHPTAEHVWLRGGAAAAGLADGLCIQNIWKLHEAVGGHAATASPQDQGLFLLDDHVQATWLHDILVYAHRGYAIYGKGTLANRSRNTLNLVRNINVENTYSNSGVARLDNYISNQINEGWSSCKSIPAVWLTQNSQSNYVALNQIGIEEANASGVKDEGTNNTVAEMEVVGYDSDAECGVEFGASVVTPQVRDVAVKQTKYAVKSSAPSTAGIDIENLKYKSIGVAPFNAALLAAGTARIQGVSKMGGTPYVASASTIDLDPGHELYSVTGTTPVNTINATHIWQRAVLWLRDVGGVINDAAIGGGNVLLATSGATISSAAGRGIVTLVFDGTNWRQA